MINCLSDPNWINPQIDVLLYLQNIRINCSDIIDKFFLSITVLGEYWLPTLVCALVYWCIDFKAGIYLFSMEGMNVILVHILKMLACVYRPWILSDKIHPSELAVPYAKGYSFPSGHSGMSSSVWGGAAFLLRNKKILCAALIGLVLLVGFSRLWLGVHTPQDVISGFTIGIILIFSMNKIINWAEKKPVRYLYLLGILDVFVILSLIYICKFASYRMDYIGGVLLVDPQKNIHITNTVCGLVTGLLNGCFLCRKFFPYDPKESSVKIRIMRGAAGCLAIIVLLKYLMKSIVMNGTDCCAAFLILFAGGIFITLIYPIIFLSAEKLIKKA